MCLLSLLSNTLHTANVCPTVIGEISENFDFTRMLIMSAIDALPLTLLSLSLCAPRIDSQKLSEELAIKLCNFSNLTYVHMYLVDK